MMPERPQDKWLAGDPAAQLKTYTDQRMKGAWWRVIVYGLLLLLFATTVTARLDAAQKNGQTGIFVAVTMLVLGRFGYYLWRLIKAKQDVAAMKKSLGLMA